MTQVLIVAWLTCGFVAAGFCHAHDQYAFPERAYRDRWTDWVTAVVAGGLVGPFFGLVALAHCEYGWSLTLGCGVKK